MKMIQIELSRPDLCRPTEAFASFKMVTWVPVELRPKKGDLVTDGEVDWEIAIVYPMIPEDRDGSSPWRKLHDGDSPWRKLHP